MVIICHYKLNRPNPFKYIYDNVLVIEWELDDIQNESSATSFYDTQSYANQNA